MTGYVIQMMEFVLMVMDFAVMVDCIAVHGAPCDGWNIYGRQSHLTIIPMNTSDALLVMVAKPARLRQNFVAQPPDDRDWPLITSDQRVADPEEDRYEDPWEWRSGEMTLGECKAEVRLLDLHHIRMYIGSC